jgi:hypothetical protein
MSTLTPGEGVYVKGVFLHIDGDGDAVIRVNNHGALTKAWTDPAHVLPAAEVDGMRAENDQLKARVAELEERVRILDECQLRNGETWVEMVHDANELRARAEAGDAILREWVDEWEKGYEADYPVVETRAHLAAPAEPSEQPASPAWPPVVGQEVVRHGKRVVITSIFTDSERNVWYRHSGQEVGYRLWSYFPVPPDSQPAEPVTLQQHEFLSDSLADSLREEFAAQLEALTKRVDALEAWKSRTRKVLMTYGDTGYQLAHRLADALEGQ